MKPRQFLNQLQHDRIVQAIRDAESKSSAEIRVLVSHKKAGDVMAAAQAEFRKLGMEKTEHRNGVLIYIAPRARSFAVVGDAGVHSHCPSNFWQQVTDEMSVHCRAGQFTLAIVHGIQKAGELLAEHFPRRPDDRNELPDEIAQK